MPVACRLRAGSYVVVDTETDEIEFDHGNDEDACQQQAAAINANAEEEMTTDRRSSEALELSSFTPGGYLATLETRDYPSLARDRDRLLYHAARLVEARRSTPVEAVAGWTLLDMIRVRDSIVEALGAAEQDFFDMMFLDEVPGPMVENPPGEFVFVQREGGIHAHPLDDDGAATIGGRHAHAFLMDGVIHFTEEDGAHQHEAGEGDETGEGTEHGHTAFLADGTELNFEPGGPHSHEVLVDTTTEGGLHQHVAKMEGGTEIATLSPVEFRALFGSAQEARAAEAVGVVVAGFPVPVFSSRVAEGEWNVTVIQAGISKNLNFWPRSLLEGRGVEIFENVPLEVLKFDLVNHGHAPHNPHNLPAGVVQNSAGLLTDLAFEATGGGKPTQAQAEAIARVMGWTVEKVFEESVGSLVAVAKTDGSEAGKDIEAKLQFAESEGLLDQYLGLSVDIAEAKPVRVNAGGEQISVRPEIDETRGVLVDFVSRPSAGGEVTGKAA